MRYQLIVRVFIVAFLVLFSLASPTHPSIATGSDCPPTNPGPAVPLTSTPASSITLLFKATGEAAIDSFGEAIAAADINGDGYPDVIVGARGDAQAGNSVPGKVYVYPGSSAGIAATPAVILHGESNGGEYGRSVAAAGDVNGDGFEDVVVGAHGVDAGLGFHQGKIYLYGGGKNGVNATPFFTLPGEVGGSEFGRSIIAAGDLDKDGYGDLIVGASGFTGTKNSQGKVYVYRGRPTGLDPIPMFTALGENENDEFGRSVAVADVNNDGYSDLIVSAPGLTKAGGSSSAPGRVYIFQGSAHGFNAKPTLILNGEQPSSKFGESIASAGDINGDGFDDIVIGARDYHCGASAAGKVYVYFGSAAGVMPTPAFTAVGMVPNGSLGRAVGFAGDVNADGYNDVLVGAPGGGPDQAVAYIYPGRPDGVSDSPIILTDGGRGSGFGFAVLSMVPINSKPIKNKAVPVIIGAPVAGDKRQGQIDIYSIAAGTMATAR